MKRTDPIGRGADGTDGAGGTGRAIPPAVILAAGRGNRLLPHTLDRPKCLMEVGARTIIEHQLAILRTAGVATIQVITGHGRERVVETLNGTVLYAHNEEFDTTQSIDSLGFLTADPEPAGLLILNSDVLFHPDLMAMLLADPRENVLLADFRAGLGEEEMKIVTDGAGRIKTISKRLDPGAAQAENLGVLRLGPAAACALVALARDRTRPANIKWVPDGIQSLTGRFDFHTLATGGLPWTEIDFPEDLDRARNEIWPRIAPAMPQGTSG